MSGESEWWVSGVLNGSQGAIVLKRIKRSMVEKNEGYKVYDKGKRWGRRSKVKDELKVHA